MAESNKSQDQNTPKPDPALKRLARLFGNWSMKGRPLGQRHHHRHIQMAAWH